MINARLILPLIITFIIGVILGPPIIRVLQRLHASQTERKELASHQKKMGTPTMGGFIFLIAIVIVSVFTMRSHPDNIPIFLLMLGFGVIGFLDDFLKVVLHRSDGLIAWQKFLLQFVVCTIFVVYLAAFSPMGITIFVPFLYDVSLDMGWVVYPFLYLVILGTVNGVNFTDGVDGLATTVTMVVSAFFAVAAVLLDVDIALLPALVIGGLLAFLVYNVNPAKTFMGDTGSLALGGFVAGMACMLGLEIFLLLVGFIYLIEVVSVIMQVLYFKATHGKRIFRMAPIHHHFELGGWSETKVVAIFSIVTALLCLVAFCGLVPPQA